MDKFEEFSSESLKKTLKDTKKRMTLRILRVVMYCFCGVMLLASLPGFLGYLRSGKYEDAQKAVMIAYQVSTPSQIHGYAVETPGRFSYDRDVVVYYSNRVGRNMRSQEQEELRVEYSLISGKLNMYQPMMSGFTHVEKFDKSDKEFKDILDEDTKGALKALEKNDDTTVSLVNITLSKTYSIEEVMKIQDEYDIEISWLALETGMESKEPPKNITQSDQYYTFGIPTKFHLPETIFDGEVLSVDASEDYVDYVLGQLEWLKANENLFSHEFWFLEDQVIDYLSNNELRCYGIQVNGPSNEILKLINDYDYERVNLSKMVLWYW